jgi:hypothetical protein
MVRHSYHHEHHQFGFVLFNMMVKVLRTWKMTLETSMRAMVQAPVKDATSAITVAYAAVDGYSRRIWPFHLNKQQEEEASTDY